MIDIKHVFVVLGWSVVFNVEIFSVDPPNPCIDSDTYNNKLIHNFKFFCSSIIRALKVQK